MSISSMLSTSTSGMNAQANRLSAVADNIANVNTTGYKRAGVEFSSFIPTTSTTQYQSGSVNSDIRHFITQQGTLQSTASYTDLAVKGNGFFLVEPLTDLANNPAPSLTRAGAFVKNDDGYLVNSANYVLMGYPASAPTTLSPVTISAIMSAAQTENAQFYANLPAGVTAPYSSTLNVYDNLGTSTALTFAWTRNTATQWQLTITPPGGAHTLDFSATTGALTGIDLTPGQTTISITPSATFPNPVVIDLQNCTQLDSPYTVIQAQALDGNAASALDHLLVEENGDAYAVFQNGSRSSAPIYTIPLGYVTAPDRLDPLPGDVYAPSSDSGPLQIGTAGEGGLGTVSRNSLEQSNVDSANELTIMIEAQNSFQLNSKVFTTSSDLLAVIVSLVR